MLVGAVLASTVAVQQAQANSITGLASFNGQINLNTTSLSTDTMATSIFNSFTGTGTGTYAGIPPESVTWNVSSGAPLSFAAGTEVINNLWSFSAAGAVYGFNLASISGYTVLPGNESATLTGFGTLTDTAPGFSSTPGNFILDITDASGGGVTASLTFAATSSATGVPDGGLTVALLGGSMIALQAIRRKLQS